MICPPGKSMSFHRKETEKIELVARPARIRPELQVSFIKLNTNFWSTSFKPIRKMRGVQRLGSDALTTFFSTHWTRKRKVVKGSSSGLIRDCRNSRHSTMLYVWLVQPPKRPPKASFKSDLRSSQRVHFIPSPSAWPPDHEP